VRVANLRGRAALVDGTRALDVAAASGGRFGPEPQSLFEDWRGFREWASGASVDEGLPYSRKDLGAPVPQPGQVFAIGVNYAAHASEAGYPPDAMPVVFTKFPSCISGPDTTVVLPGPTVDWEVELVIVIGSVTRGVTRQRAWDHVAGLMVGQDLSERTMQMQGARPQFSLAKSFPGFGPTGPYLTTVDELDDPSDLGISCSVSGEVMQSARTSSMVYDVPELIQRLSSVCTLRPGDLIFSGTPAGVGNARVPKRFLGERDELVSRIDGLGELETRFAVGT
jgi:2-keto-4-pentenoate hydratase/2-oxohepta-3-ene-1,7-dioic acid hydratase in catechol pathway